ncbi:MAG TPA: PAS-domain containing protein [Acetobacteraceae bacterium]|nr:PAS-domain containing protein [Acetobacteraceae bacterium]
MSGYAAAPRRRRRRRRQSSAVMRTPEQLHQHGRHHRISGTQALSCAAIAVICLALIALIWLNTAHAIGEQTDDQRGRVEAAITAQATTLAIQAQHELMMIDQSLSVLQAAWDANPDTFRLDDWRKKMPALTAVADDLFIANAQHIIVQDIVPAAVGQGIGSVYGNFTSGSLEPLKPDSSVGRDNAMLVGELGSAAVVRQYIMYLVRPLTTPAGWLVGASYRSQALTDVFATAGLGPGGLAALVDTHRGGVQALAGTAAVRPTLAIANTPMYQAMLARPDGGVWIGTTPIDNVERILAFHRVPGRDLMVVVGVTTDLALGPAEAWAAAADSLATIASLLVLAIAGTVLWEVWHWRRIRRRQRDLAQTQALLAGVQAELGPLRLHAAAGEAQVQALLGVTTAAGVALVDPEHRLTRWNHRFPASLGLPPELLRDGVSLTELLRHQVLAEPRETPIEVEADIAQRLALLHPESGAGALPWTAADGTARIVRSQPMPDGGLVLQVMAAAEMPAAPAQSEAPAGDTVEWS